MVLFLSCMSRFHLKVESEELYLLRCTPSINAIQAQDTIPSATLLVGYSDLFPPKLPDSLPPHREVDHRIDLAPGSVPPGCKMYRMLH